MASFFAETARSYADGFASAPSPWSNIKANVSPAVHGHLLNVYSNLTKMLILSAITACAQSAGYVNLAGTLTGFGCIACLLAFSFTSATPQNHALREGLLYGFAATKGLALGPLIAQAGYFSPTIVPKALFGTAIIFGCFTLSVLVAPASRRDIMYTRSLLITATTLLGTLSLVNMFARSGATSSIELYLGLMVFAGYVIYDTQLLIAKAEAGSKDYLNHSLEL
ncbi:hypothetical protein HKX48_005370 [Thoreauomyces humboldtii]|nr:hypothetical protein HKX48_005370 [Thoreauomyces humboldtii]